jgi:hypothetical protein
MSKKTKLLMAGLIIGLVGIAATIGIAIGTDMIMSREESKTYHFEETFDTLKFPDKDNRLSEAGILQGDDYRVEAYIKAWRPEPIDIDSILSFEVKDGELYITVNPFPNDFLGMFPQPYELNIDVYTPLGDSLITDWGIE